MGLISGTGAIIVSAYKVSRVTYAPSVAVIVE